jgi:hypothetical protein
MGRFFLGGLAASCISLAGISLAHASVYELTTSYADGGSFSGVVTFSADDASVTGVDGYLREYAPYIGYTGDPSDELAVQTYYGPSADGVTFNGGVWTGLLKLSGIAFNYTVEGGAPVYVDGYDGSSIGDHHSFVSSGFFSAAPEPATWAMMFGGLAMVGGTLRYGRRKNPARLAYRL